MCMEAIKIISLFHEGIYNTESYFVKFFISRRQRWKLLCFKLTIGNFIRLMLEFMETTFLFHNYDVSVSQPTIK
jgi:hypothetical protein